MDNISDNTSDDKEKFIKKATENYLLYFTDGEPVEKAGFLTMLNKNIDTHNDAVQAIKNNNILELSNIIRNNGKTSSCTQEEINKIFTEAWLLQNMNAVQYLSGKNSSQYIANPHFDNESVAKHLCINGNLPALQLFMEMYEPDLNAQGRATNINNMCALSEINFMNFSFHLDAPSEPKYTVFDYAVKNNHVHIMDYLLNYMDIDYQKSLEIAATKKQVEAFEHLLQSAPDNLDYERILILALGFKHQEIAKTLIEKMQVDINGVVSVEKIDTLDYFASMYPILSTSNNAPTNNAPPEKKLYEYNALFLACRDNNIELIDYLIQHNADLSAHNALALSEVKNINTVKHLILEHNLPNDVAVNKKLHANFSADDYAYLVQALESRDLANELQHDLPITSSNKPKSKI